MWTCLAFAALGLLQEPSPVPQDEGLREIELPEFPEGAAYVLGRLSNVELIGVRRSEPVYLALLTRDGLEPVYRREALMGLASLHGTSPLEELIASLREPRGALAGRVALLLASPPEQLTLQRESLVRLARHEDVDGRVRRGALAAVVLADQGVGGVVELAAEGKDLTVQLLGALPMVPDPALRAGFFSHVWAWLDPSTDHTLRRAAILASPYLTGHEGAVFGALADIVTGEGEGSPSQEIHDAAVRALLEIPEGKAPSKRLPSLVTTLRRELLSAPLEERSEPSYRRALQLARALVSRLPPPESDGLSQELDGLGIPTLTVRAVPHILQFDRTHLVVEVGQPFELVFTNPGVMPHNLVLAKPGALELVGAAADRLVGAAAPPGQHPYVPDLPEVLGSTELLNPGTSTSKTFVVHEVGDHPYLCSVPGHWVRMNGTLHVVRDVEEWRAEHADLLNAGLTPPRHFVRAWRSVDVSGELGRRAADPGLVEHPQTSLERGEALFGELCATCHRAGGEGNRVGPDLAEVAGRLAPRELLLEVLEPARRIEDAYAIWAVELQGGERLFGRIPHRDEDVVHLTLDPRSQDPPLVLDRSEVTGMVRTRNSTMPMGLLNTLTAEEILDLLAFLQAASRD